MKKLSVDHLKQIIKEEMDRPYGMGTGGAPMQNSSEHAEDFDIPSTDNLGDVDVDDGLTGTKWDNEEMYDDPEDRPTFEEAFKIPGQQLDERAGMDQVATAVRNALNDCANLTSNVIQVITRKKPEWKEALKAVRQAEEALDLARQSLMGHG